MRLAYCWVFSDRHYYSMWWISQKASWVLCLTIHIILGTNHIKSDDGFKVAWLELCNYILLKQLWIIIINCSWFRFLLGALHWRTNYQLRDLLGFYWVLKCIGLSFRNYVPTPITGWWELHHLRSIFQTKNPMEKKEVFLIDSPYCWRKTSQTTSWDV